MNLSKDQQRVAERLQLRARLQMNELARVSQGRTRHLDSEPHVVDDSLDKMKAPRLSNAIGVLGRRGSGKTTVMVEILRQLEKLGPTEPPHCWKILRQPQDLSYAPREFPHGLTVIHWLHESLRKIYPAYACSKPVRDAFECASHSYFRGADGFNQMVRDLAVSAEQYAQVAATEIQKRQSLRSDIQRWLDASARALNCAGFVLGVDDADLAPANRHQNLVWSLLDELHQDRLLFIVAGDLQRLERRLAEEDATSRRLPINCESGEPDRSLRLTGLDYQAAADLVYKVLPQVDRTELEVWPDGLRVLFPPGADRTVGQLIEDDLAFVHPVIRDHARYLLPEWARGLENVHRELLRLRELKPESEQEKFVLNQELLGFLAESSFDFDLARTLRRRPLNQWASAFSWQTSRAAADANWAAIQLSLRDDELHALLPDDGLLTKNVSARWIEVLIDWALEEHAVSAWRLVERVPWLLKRLQETEVVLARPDGSVDPGQRDDPQGFVAALPWLRWSDSNPPGMRSFSIGALPLLQWLQQERVLIPHGHDDLMWNLGKRDLPRTGRGLRWPRRIRTLIRLVNAVAAQPWSVLRSLPAGVQTINLARVAAGLTYAGIHGSTVVSSDVRFELALPSNSSLVQWDDSAIAAWFKKLYPRMMAGLPTGAADGRSAIELLTDLVNAPWFGELNRA